MNELITSINDAVWGYVLILIIGRRKTTMIGFFHENEEYGCLSNWYPAEFDYVRHFTSSEQFMMYHKVQMFRKYNLADQIMRTSDPARCKKIAGQKFPEFDSFLWEKTRKETPFFVSSYISIFSFRPYGAFFLSA